MTEVNAEEPDLFSFNALVITPMDLTPALAEMVERIQREDASFMPEAFSAWLYVKTGQYIKKRRNEA